MQQDKPIPPSSVSIITNHGHVSFCCILNNLSRPEVCTSFCCHNGRLKMCLITTPLQERLHYYTSSTRYRNMQIRTKFTAVYAITVQHESFILNVRRNFYRPGTCRGLHKSVCTFLCKYM